MFRRRSSRAEPQQPAAPGPQRFFFIHVMKTAGTTFALQLQRQFHGPEIYPSERDREGDSPQVYASVRKLLDLPPERRAQVRLYSGHFPYVASQVIDDDVITLTLLRDPVDRTISVLKHFKRLHERYHELPLEEIYDDEFVFSHFIDNHQTRIFSVQREDNPDAFSSSLSYEATLEALSPERDSGAVAKTRPSRITVDRGRLELAQANLERIDVLGLTTQYPAFIEELRRRFGWWPEGLDAQARANVSEEPWTAHDGLRARIAADNAYDMQLYAHAVQVVAGRT